MTRGPKSVGFVAIDDFEIIAEVDAPQCSYKPPEANPKPETTTTLESSSGVKSCDFEENLCSWEIQPPEATFSWRRTSIAELEANGDLHPEHTLDGGTDGRNLFLSSVLLSVPQVIFSTPPQTLCLAAVPVWCLWRQNQMRNTASPSAMPWPRLVYKSWW